MTDIEIRCPDCWTWHYPPRCSYDPDAPCVECGGPLWMPAGQQPRDSRCNACWRRAEGLMIRGEEVSP